MARGDAARRRRQKMWSRAQCSGNGAHCSHFCARIAPICARCSCARTRIAPARARALLPHVRAHCSRARERCFCASAAAAAGKQNAARGARPGAPSSLNSSSQERRTAAQQRSGGCAEGGGADGRSVCGAVWGRAGSRDNRRVYTRAGTRRHACASFVGGGLRRSFKSACIHPVCFCLSFSRPRLVSREAPVPPLSSSLPSSSRWSLRRHRRAAAAARAGHPGYAEVVVIATAVNRCRNRPPLSRHRPL